MFRFDGKRCLKILFVVLFLFSLLGTAPVQAQAPGPMDEPLPGEDSPVNPPVPGAVFDAAEGAWMMPAGPAPEELAAPEEPAAPESETPEATVPEDGVPEAGEDGAALQAMASIPDQFGYTYAAATYSWKDAVTGGTNTGLEGSGDITDEISLPFTFNFYENAYSKVYISSYGYLTFTGDQENTRQSQLLSPGEPNNVIAPYWGPTTLNASGTDAQVFYKSFGTSPNRYFVVQWNKVKNYDNTFTFEVILHEKGDIVFQYNTMTYGSSGWSCATGGIEDIRASDGLVSSNFCEQRYSKAAVRFTRPASSARLLVFPYEFGSFTTAGKISTFTTPIINTGSAGSDRYDIEFTEGPWGLTFTNAATGAALTDTNGNGKVDTGPVAQKATFKLGVRIQAPSILGVGDSTRQTVTIRSSKNVDKSKSAFFSLTVPAPFVATYEKAENNAVLLHYIEPALQRTLQAAPEGTFGNEMVTAESPSGNQMTAWSVGRCLSDCTRYVQEIKYTVYDRSGTKVKGVTTLSSLSSATRDTYDRYPLIAAAPNGTFGVVWTRRIHGSGGTNYNVFFQRVSEAGALIGSPVKVTSITTYGSTFLYEPAIAATGDNRFTLAWRQNSDGYNDIYRAVYNTAGALVAAPKKLTADTSSSEDSNRFPALAGLQGNKVIMTFKNEKDDISYLKFLVMNSGGTVTKAITLIDSQDLDQSDVVQLATGEILIAWEELDVRYVLLDPSTYAQMGSIEEFFTVRGDSVSVTTDSLGHGIFTWLEYDNWSPNLLYYAVIDHEGEIITEPMIFATDAQYIDSSHNGGRIASHQMPATTGGVDLALSGSTWKLAPSGGAETVQINVANLGLQSATAVTLTVEIPAGLAVTDSNLAANCAGTTCTWDLAEMAFLTNGIVTLDVLLPDAPAGTTFNLDFSITSAETDDIPANNTRSISVITANQGYVPYIRK